MFACMFIFEAYAKNVREGNWVLFSFFFFFFFILRLYKFTNSTMNINSYANCGCWWTRAYLSLVLMKVQ